jgi:DNA processing protein
MKFDVEDPVLARAAWSRIAEPGDRAAGVLVGRVGPVRALEWLVNGASGVVPGGGGESGRGERGRGVREAVDRWRTRVETLDPRRELRVLQGLGGRFLTPEEPQWPTGLADLGDSAPLALWMVGSSEALADPAGFLTPSAAIVGSRACTHYGELVTAQLVSGLVERGIAIVSGGAFGIDAAAHRAALGCGGRTGAVMAGGVDRLYPVGNEPMLREVARVGLVLSEVPPGSAPRRERFLQRNRLIAAITGVTVVVEAGWRSGARNTAGHAAGLARPVGAVPGPVTSACSAGCHRLMRDGIATCVTDAAEVLELLGPVRLEFAAPDREVPLGILDGLDSSERAVLDCLPVRRVASTESVALASGLPVRVVLASLGALERSGLAVRVGQGWSRTRQDGW